MAADLARSNHGHGWNTYPPYLPFFVRFRSIFDIESMEQTPCPEDLCVDARRLAGVCRERKINCGNLRGQNPKLMNYTVKKVGSSLSIQLCALAFSLELGERLRRRLPRFWPKPGHNLADFVLVAVCIRNRQRRMTGAENPSPSNFRRLVLGCIEAKICK